MLVHRPPISAAVVLAAIFAVTAAAAQQPAAQPSPAVAAARADIERSLGFVPGFLAVFPEGSLPGAWQAFRGVQLSDATELAGKEKELIGLAVAAQIPCVYCVDAHARAARAMGASDPELREAVAMAALTRHWSTILNGSLTDEAEFRAWADAAFEHAGRAAQSNVRAAAIEVVDAASARRDIAQTFGAVPAFLDDYPESGLAGAWLEMKTLQFSPDTALPNRVKELVGLAVSAQIPCRYCAYVHTKAARLAGASEAQLREALAMAAQTRHWSTVLHGNAIDLDTFRAEFDAILRRAAETAAAAETKSGG
jgi:AhpD family alkylhydroperoxidase